MPYKEVVVATGGGAVVRHVNWGFLHHGIVVWLDGPPELLARRAVGDGTAKRPMLAQADGAAQARQRPSLRCTHACQRCKVAVVRAALVEALQLGGADPGQREPLCGPMRRWLTPTCAAACALPP